MKHLLLLAVSLAAGFLPGGATVQNRGRCDALGNVQFLCGFAGPEDLVAVPGGRWVIASGDPAPVLSP
jgi:hypothetical protein